MLDAGAAGGEIVALLVVIASVVGLPAIVASAPKVALALGFDADDLLDEPFAAG